VPLGSRVKVLPLTVLELGALGQSLHPTFSVWLHPSPFLRELFKNIEVRPLSQALISSSLNPLGEVLCLLWQKIPERKNEELKSLSLLEFNPREHSPRGIALRTNIKD
jgi:hypothetical protein